MTMMMTVVRRVLGMAAVAGTILVLCLAASCADGNGSETIRQGEAAAPIAAGAAGRAKQVGGPSKVELMEAEWMSRLTLLEQGYTDRMLAAVRDAMLGSGYQAFADDEVQGTGIGGEYYMDLSIDIQHRAERRLHGLRGSQLKYVSQLQHAGYIVHVYWMKAELVCGASPGPFLAHSELWGRILGSWGIWVEIDSDPDGVARRRVTSAVLAVLIDLEKKIHGKDPRYYHYLEEAKELADDPLLWRSEELLQDAFEVDRAEVDKMLAGMASDHPSEKVRRTAEELLRTKDRSARAKVVLGLLSDSDPGVQRAGLAVVASDELTLSEESWLALLDSRSPHVWRAAAKCAAAAREAWSVARFFWRAAKSEDEQTRIVAFGWHRYGYSPSLADTAVAHLRALESDEEVAEAGYLFYYLANHDHMSDWHGDTLRERDLILQCHERIEQARKDAEEYLKKAR